VNATSNAPAGAGLAAAILDGMPDAAVLVGADGSILFANARVLDLLGWLPGELIGQSVEQLVPGAVAERHVRLRQQFTDDPLVRVMGSGLELDARHRDGRPIPVEISLSPVVRSGQPMVIAAIRDAHEQRALRAEVVRERDRLEQTRSRLAVLEDRDRIARDLHDGVIQRLFAAGLHLQAAIGRPDEERLTAVIDEIDEAIKEIRTTIFGLHGRRGLTEGLEHALRSALKEAQRLLGHAADLTIVGDIERVSDDLRNDAMAVVRELLTNVARHAQATRTIVGVVVSDDELVISVADDGVGFAAAENTSGSGVANVSERALRRRGTATFASPDAGGTTVTWQVPLSVSVP
jgi:PAS domain S-box-containing protein